MPLYKFKKKKKVMKQNKERNDVAHLFNQKCLVVRAIKGRVLNVDKNFIDKKIHSCALLFSGEIWIICRSEYEANEVVKLLSCYSYKMHKRYIVYKCCEKQFSLCECKKYVNLTTQQLQNGVLI